MNQLKDFLGEKIWIVTMNNGADVELKEFFAFIRKEEAIPTVNLSGLLRDPAAHFDPDGRPMDFTLGALFSLSSPFQMGIHLANVGPSDERGQIQHQYALSLLGQKGAGRISPALLAADGEFRKLISEAIAGTLKGN